MKREDKIFAGLFGGLLFASLFYFIWSALKNPSPLGGEAAFNDSFGGNDEDVNFNDREDTGTVKDEDLFSDIVSTTAVKAPGGAKK